MRLLALVLIALPTAPLAFPATCTAVDRDRILASDLPKEAYGALDSTLVIGLAPGPGAHRTFTGHELAALGKLNGIVLDTPLTDVCFERAVTPLTAVRVQTAMQSTLGTAAAHIEVVDLMRQPVPSGELDFPRSGLSLSPTSRGDAPTFWRGTLRYSAQRTMPVWASVRILEERPVLIATHEIRNRATILAEDVSTVRLGINPFIPHFEAPENVVGHLARKTIPGGSVMSELLIAVAPDIEQGETVHISATSGFTSITFDAVARTSGRKGDRVVLLNPESHRTFRALVDGKGSAHVGEGN